MADRFEGATEEELQEYVEGSAQQSGETDTAWALRVQRSEADLLAKIKARCQEQLPAQEEQS